MSRLLQTFMLLWCFLAGAANAAVTPHDTLRQASEQLFTTFRAEQQQLTHERQRVYALVDNALGRYVDFPLVAQLVLGKHWRTASDAQRARFTAEFHKMLVRFYTGAFVEDPSRVGEVLAHSATLIRFLPAQMNPDGVRATVAAEVHLPTGRQVPVSFALHRRAAEWKVYDVTVEGISLLTNYRTSFSREIQQAGLDGLIDRLAARNREFLPETQGR